MKKNMRTVLVGRGGGWGGLDLEYFKTCVPKVNKNKTKSLNCQALRSVPKVGSKNFTCLTGFRSKSKWKSPVTIICCT